MKKNKISLFILSFATIVILNTTKVNAILPRVVYNPVNVFISNVMKISPIVLIVAYFIGAIIYYMKSKKDKKIKIKRLVICLILLAIVATILYCCADIVYEAGATYTSRPVNL